MVEDVVQEFGRVGKFGGGAAAHGAPGGVDVVRRITQAEQCEQPVDSVIEPGLERPDEQGRGPAALGGAEAMQGEADLKVVAGGTGHFVTDRFAGVFKAGRAAALFLECAHDGGVDVEVWLIEAADERFAGLLRGNHAEQPGGSPAPGGVGGTIVQKGRERRDGLGAERLQDFRRGAPDSRVRVHRECS